MFVDFVYLKTYMLDIVLVVLVLLISCGLCFHNYNLQHQIYTTSEYDAGLLRKAAEHSIMASNTICPLLSVLEASKGVCLLEIVNGKYGTVITNDIFMVDTQQMLSVLQQQKNLIMKDLTTSYPALLPVHPLTSHAGFST